MNSDLKKQAKALKVTFSRKAKSYHSPTCFINIIKSGNHSALLHKMQFSTELNASPSKSLNCGKPF